MANIEGKKIEFMNGESNQFDVIIFATGYRSTVGRWLKVCSTTFIAIEFV
jgi:indole-3-pyruvate monooxygenase